MSFLRLKEVKWDLSLHRYYLSPKTTRDPDCGQWRQVGKTGELEGKKKQSSMFILTLILPIRQTH